MRESLFLLLLPVVLLDVGIHCRAGETGNVTSSRASRLGWPLLNAQPPIVRTLEGALSGLTDTSADGLEFFSFRGVPYARPPNRFRLPERHPGWSGVRKADQHGSKCLQWLYDELVGSEDCLFANVYTRHLPPDDCSECVRLPVMVFIHGGGFIDGDGDAENVGPRYLMDENIVLVTFNYRLGPLGFFTTHDAAASGNYGLRDQLLLLHWVQDNIAAFGGEPRLVTIFGHSAGAASVSILVISPLGSGLFHRAISQSGSAVASFAASGRRKGLARRYAAELSCSGSSSAAYVECARAASPQQLMEADHRIRLTEIFTDGRFVPRVDREAALPVLPFDLHDTLVYGYFSQVPWMAGFNEEEGAHYIQNLPEEPGLLQLLYQGDLLLWGILADIVNANVETSIVECFANATVETHKVYHFLVERLGEASATNILPFVRLFSDRLFVSSSSHEMLLTSRHTPVYKYLLDHRGPGRLHYHPPQLPELGPTHGDELAYLFSREGRPLEPANTPARTMIRFMVSLWTTFARTGRPDTDVLPMPEWPRYREYEQGMYMRLNSQPSLGERLFQERVDFWQTVRINEPWRQYVEECSGWASADAAGPTRHLNHTIVIPF